MSFFNNRWKAPHCVGAIDSSHFPIIAPEPHSYHNRKGWHPVTQAVVDGKGPFKDVCGKYPKQVHDAQVLKQSCDCFSQHTVNISGRDVEHLADEAFLWYRPTNPAAAEVLSQNKHRIVETTFARCKGKWRFLLKRNKLDLTEKMVLVCWVFIRSSSHACGLRADCSCVTMTTTAGH